jgi:hypothetical protein
MSNTTRLTIECTPELVRMAKLIAAMRGVTMRELITALIMDAGKAHRIQVDGDTMVLTEPVPPTTTPTAIPTATENKALEDAMAAHLASQVEVMNTEHERRIAAGTIKG